MFLLLWVVLALVEPTGAQLDDKAPVQAQSEPAKAEEIKPLPALVIEVEGSVDWAAIGVSPLAAEGWTPVRLNDELKPGTQVRTGLRSHVNLKFGETSVVSLRSATFASIDQCSRSATTESVRVGLGYGTVRGGSSEGTIRSDVIVDSPVATLAKRGTEGWEMDVEAGTGRFRVSLAEYGLVEAIQKLGGGRTQSRDVRPGEYATQANIANMWLKQNIFDRNVWFYTPEGMTEADAQYALTNTSGMNVLTPGGGMEVNDRWERVNASWVMDQIAANFPPGTSPPTTAVGTRGPISRPEGNFGTGLTFRPVTSAKAKVTPQQTRG
jgi:hypothetical protein